MTNPGELAMRLPVTVQTPLACVPHAQVMSIKLRESPRNGVAPNRPEDTPAPPSGMSSSTSPKIVFVPARRKEYVPGRTTTSFGTMQKIAETRLPETLPKILEFDIESMRTHLLIAQATARAVARRYFCKACALSIDRG
ncbi:MAG: hypothetical protein KDG55_02030 [Rhodocyclaceae bacterium]|nr:hypothetical protein [Rhodocyclaceae bacterium]